MLEFPAHLKTEKRCALGMQNRHIVLAWMSFGVIVFTLALTTRPVAAGDVTGNGANAIADPSMDLLPKEVVNQAGGRATATFNSHPKDIVTQDFKKNFNVKPPGNKPWCFYLEIQQSGDAWDFGLCGLQIAPFVNAAKKNAWLIGGKVTPHVQPGKAEPPLPVDVLGTVDDPIGFSANPASTFDFHSNGLADLFSLLAGITFDLGVMRTWTAYRSLPVWRRGLCRILCFLEQWIKRLGGPL